MKLPLRKKIILVFLCVLLFLCAACKNTIKKEKDPSPEQKLESLITERVSPSASLSQEEKDFLQEYNTFFGETEEKDPQQTLMDGFSACSKIKVASLDNNKAMVHFDVPDLPGILKTAIASLTPEQQSEENVSELIQKTAYNILASGRFERRIADVEVEYTMSAEGEMQIVESKEYLDALYGGLLSAAEQAFAHLQQKTDGEEVSK